MSKKSIDRKEATGFIEAARGEGKADSEIYDLLTEKHYDKKAVALLVLSTVKKENKEKYKIYNNLLVFLLALTALFKILTVFNLMVATQSAAFIFLLFLTPLFNILFLVYVAKYQAAIYRFCGLMSIVNAFRSITSNAGMADIVLMIVLSAIIAGLSFWLDQKMFPNYKPSNLKKDAEGNYQLD